MNKLQNPKEIEIYQKLYKNKMVYDEQIYLLSYELMKDDEEIIEKVKKLLENKVLKQIQHLFNRESPYGDGQNSIVDWLKYVYWNELS